MVARVSHSSNVAMRNDYRRQKQEEITRPAIIMSESGGADDGHLANRSYSIQGVLKVAVQ